MKCLFLKLSISIALIFAFSFGNTLKAQISYGGTPLFYTPSSSLRGVENNDFFIEMPSVNVDSLLKDDELNKSNMRGAFRFAHKFYVNIEKGETGKNYTLPDGTKVWQVGIRSNGAYSINVLFSEYKVPPGGKLFLYNSDQTHVIGSFTHENNSQGNILPIQPVDGDEIIVEYQEPAGSEFEAKLKITEVNHDYRGILRFEPGTEPPAGNTYTCMPDILCADPENDNMRSVALITINGVYICTGTLLNTTNDDGSPILLTAVHCLNKNFQKPDTDYAEVAGTIVCFFNYRKPVCNQTVPAIKRMKGTQEMSVAGASPLSVVTKNDMALLKLNETPPDYYQPYYAGWNIDSNAGTNVPFVNIHHPNGLVSKYGRTNMNLSMATFPEPFFNSGIHWKISGWDVGSTAGGSSGSPLFDKQGFVVGGLSGGSSECFNNEPDYFFALYKSWEDTPDAGVLLKNALDPKKLGITQWSGHDPNEKNPFIRLKNGDYNNEDPLLRNELVSSALTDTESEFVFGNNFLKTKEFAEEFVTEKDVEIFGTYLLSPVTSLKQLLPITIKVYKDALSEENLVTSEIFRPTYQAYNTTKGSFIENDKTMSAVATESFVKFQEKVKVGTKFYVSYEIAYPFPAKIGFSTYNMIFQTPEKNSAWLCDADGKWFPATEHPVKPMSAALAIEPLVRCEPACVSSPPLIGKKEQIIYLKASQQLQVNTDNPDEKGTIFIYSITGQLLSKMPYQSSEPVNIPLSIGNNNIVIVKALSENGVKTGKIVL